VGQLTTHVLDTSAGRPGSGIRVELFLLGDERQKVSEGLTNEDGRIDVPLAEGATFVAGQYELVFHAGTYLAESGATDGPPRFLDEVVLRFGVSAPEEHYHVPLLLSAHGYTTYRGS